MDCSNCGLHIRKNVMRCSQCGHILRGGVVFVTGISGSGVRSYLDHVLIAADEHKHEYKRHDIGNLMREHADLNLLAVRWDRILDADPGALRLLRSLAIRDVAQEFALDPNIYHIIDLHLSFRWRAYLTKGFLPRILEPFRAHARIFVNVVEDVANVEERLKQSSWGDRRKPLELFIWRDEELFLTDLFADICGLERSYAIAAGEPPSMLEQLIWHPEKKKVYLSFPITNLLNDSRAAEEIRKFRDIIRDFLIVFDPHACKDYDETYLRDDWKALRREIGDITEERDYRFIDQADAIVVYFPVNVPSKGVDAEMNHARRTGKPIYMYKPPGGSDPGPFDVPPSHLKHDQEEFIALLRKEFPIGLES